jgi:hypothetical protein
MSRLHGLDDMFPADFEDSVEHELRQLLIASQSSGTTEELASEASIVAAMAHAINPQPSLFQPSKRRAPLARAIGSRAAKVAIVTGIAVISTSAAAAAGLLPRTVQSAVERAAQSVGWHLPERDEPATTTMEHSEPTTIATTTDHLDVTVHPTMPPAVAVDQNLTSDELCRDWALSIRSGIALEPNSTRALVAMAERAGQGIERLCSPYTPTAPEVLATTDATTIPGTVPTPTAATFSSVVVPTASTAPPPTDDTPPTTAHTLPPQAQGNGPPAGEPRQGDHTTNGNGNGNGYANTAGDNGNATGNGNANANANPHAPAGNGNATGNRNGNANANSDGNATDPPSANSNGTDHGSG